MRLVSLRQRSSTSSKSIKVGRCLKRPSASPIFQTSCFIWLSTDLNEQGGPGWRPPNHPVQRTGASRVAQVAIGRLRRLAPVVEPVVMRHR